MLSTSLFQRLGGLVFAGLLLLMGSPVLPISLSEASAQAAAAEAIHPLDWQLSGCSLFEATNIHNGCLDALADQEGDAASSHSLQRCHHQPFATRDVPATEKKRAAIIFFTIFGLAWLAADEDASEGGGSDTTHAANKVRVGVSRVVHKSGKIKTVKAFKFNLGPFESGQAQKSVRKKIIGIDISQSDHSLVLHYCYGRDRFRSVSIGGRTVIK